MRVLGIIPARYGSTRFPGKPLIEIDGVSMIRRVYEQVKKASIITDVVIATDDKRIYDFCLEFGADVMMTDITHLNGTERCAEVVNKTSSKYDVVINIQGDEPYIQPSQINQVAGLFHDPSCQIGTLIKACDDSALLSLNSIIKVVVDRKGRALYFSRAVIPFVRSEDNTPIVRSEDNTPIFYKHIGLYAYRPYLLQSLVLLPPSTLELAESLEQLRWLENGYTIDTAVTTHESLAVDTPEDLERLKRHLEC